MPAESLLVEILLTRTESQQLRDVLPEGDEKHKLQKTIDACDLEVEFIRTRLDQARREHLEREAAGRVVNDSDVEPTVEIVQLRTRLTGMGDLQLLRFGMTSQYLCCVEAKFGMAPAVAYFVQLLEARAEWMRRKLDTVVQNSF